MNKNRIIGLIIILIMLVGYRLRIQNYSSVPLPGQSTDEYSNTWVGLSLIRLGLPVGISGLVGIKDYPTYINPDRIFSSTVPGGALAISYPWFDHPPLMGLLTGTFAYIRGDRNFEDVSVVTIRKPMIVLGVVTVGLVFGLSTLWFGPMAGIIGALLYATSPLVVVGSRMVQSENGLVPVWLASLIFLSLTTKKNYPNLVRLAAVFAGLAVLFKLSGVAAIISGALLLVRRKKNLIEFLAISISVALLFVWYGLAIDARKFIEVFLSNSSRVYGIGLDAVYDLFVSTKITSTKYLTDGWPLLGWLSVVYLSASKSKSTLPIVACVASYLAIYVLFGSASYGWYRIPFMPFLFIAGGYLIAEGLRRPTFVCVLALLIPLGINLSKLFDISQAPLLVLAMRFGVLTLMMSTLACHVWPANKKVINLSRTLLLLVLVLAVSSNIVYLNKIDVDYWYKVN